ncbi:LANO_0D01134g1_1 [Lachancea nothofagi CBS 11611]|uniref:LANO_0D01134g1_1 n=1 Tax=Lachancea nothofagi CBS 11611 TaxID=1266666 RepID=A0A1G4JD86_9SACH|nr:LANO_0D01134g1_1 [Lachancea nothofagi CBS 11611]
MNNPNRQSGKLEDKSSAHKRTVKARLYQYFRLSSSFLFAALGARWAILFPLVGLKFTPGGIHEFLCYLMVYAGVSEIVWTFVFHGLKRTIFSRTMLKDINLLYFVITMHFHDDYEHALVLKSIAYSTFIASLALSQTYCHWCKLFRAPSRSRRTVLWKIDTFATLPVLYLSEFYLLLLNLQTPSYHTYPWLQIVNKAVLVAFIPVSLHSFRKQVAAW